MLDKAIDKIKSQKNAQKKKKMKQRILSHKTCQELNGQNSPVQGDKQELLLSSSKTQTSKLHLPLITQLTQKKDPNFNKFRKSGVYQLTCHECNKKYIGQTG